MLRVAAFVALTSLLLAPLGCGAPNKNEIKLRKDKQELNQKVERLTSENDQLKAQIRGLEENQSTVERLPQEQLAQLWTVAGVRFGRLTGVDGGAEGRPLKIYLQPYDEEGGTLKAAGDITVGVFDLDAESEVKLAEWTFEAAKAKQLWSSGGLINEYVLRCDWEGDAPEAGTKVLVRAKFVDALTGRPFEARKDVTVE